MLNKTRSGVSLLLEMVLNKSQCGSLYNMCNCCHDDDFHGNRMSLLLKSKPQKTVVIL